MALTLRSLAPWCAPLIGLALTACDPKLDAVDEDTDGEAASASSADDPDETTSDGPTSDSDAPPDPTDGPDETAGTVDPPTPIGLGDGGVAVRYADRDLARPDVPSDGESTGTSGGDEPAHAPDALMVELSTLEGTCEDASPLLPCGLHGSLTLIIEPEQQQLGTYILFEEVDAFFGESGEIRDGNPEDCSFGFGTLSGVLEITEIDAFHVAGRLTQTDDWLEIDANVEFDVPICSYE